MKIKKIIALLLLVFLAFGTITVSAADHSYTYNHWIEVVSAPFGYTVDNVIDGVDLGIGILKQPSDLFVAENGNIYVSDTGNNRVINLNPDYTVNWIWDKVFDGETEIALNSPKGLFVDKDNNIYICLINNALVLKCSPEGKVLVKYKSPESPLLNEGFVFEP